MPNFGEIAQNATEIWRFYNFSRWRPSAILDFQKFKFQLRVPIGGLLCVTTPYFAKIGLTVAEILPIFDYSRWRTAAILKNCKIAISQLRFERFRQNLACRRSSTLLSVPTVKNLKFPKSKMAAAAILKNRKSAISPERFDRSSRNLVR